MKIRSYLFIALLSLIACAGSDRRQIDGQRNSISVFSNLVRATGRTEASADHIKVYWSGTSMLVSFKGTSLRAVMEDETGKNYFNVILDGQYHHYMRVSSDKKSYPIIHNLKGTIHTIEIIKRNEWDAGHTKIYSFETDGSFVNLPTPKKRTIEFYGNSITAGYAIENYTGGDQPDSTYTNNYATYAAITARHFKADLYCTVRSGIGITVGFTTMTMPEIYDRINPMDSSSRWQFQNRPQVIVINLMQNDYALLNSPNHPNYKARFPKGHPAQREMIEAYASFVKTIRSANPSAHIICALGSMSAVDHKSPFKEYIQEAVTSLKDQNVSVLVFPYLAKKGHPRKEENMTMAEILIKHIDAKVRW